MSGIDFLNRVRLLREAQRWGALEKLLRRPHPLFPGEREAFLELLQHETELGHKLRVQLDATGFRVERTN